METLRLLITDDEPAMRLAVERALEGFTVRVPDLGTDVGFIVEQAETGEQLLDRVSCAAPDILLLDLKLPGVSGLDVLDQMAGKHPDMLPIMITAYASIETAVSATKRGAYDFLAKPFTPDELKSTVRKAAIRVVLAKQARRLAEEKSRVRFQFIQVLGHELKSPLNAIDGYLQIMAAQSAGDNINAYSHPITRCMVRVEHMRKLIADLLDMTRIESGQKLRQLDTVDVLAVANTSIETMLPEASKRSISIDLQNSEPVTMTADRGEIEMVLNNLISNAIKYNKDGGRVTVVIERHAEQVLIRVADTGIGMSKDDLARLFDEFVRIKNSQTRNILGSGLGLSILRKLALLYGGDATVESEPGVGSTFTVTLKDANQP